jgi:cytochrome b
MHQLRLYHAVLAILVLASYFSADWGLVHAWLGYGVAAVILLRLVMAFLGAPQLGLMRFYPHFHGLKLDNVFTHPAISHVLLMGIAVCLVGVTATGIMLDNGRALGMAQTRVAAVADEADGAPTVGRGEREDNPVEEAHELLANLLMLLVGGHVAYLLVFKRPLVRFMTFLGGPSHPK